MPKKKEKELVSESESESDSDSSDSESEHSSVEEETVETTDVKLEESNDNSKDKKVKKQVNFETVLDEQRQLLEQLETVQNNILELNKQQQKEHSSLKKIYKSLKRLDVVLEKHHAKDLKIASKERRKRKTPNTGGFNAKTEVPKILREYIGKELIPDDDVKLSRPQVLSLLNKAFKRDNLKDGQVTKLNKKVAKKLGRKKDEVIEFGEFQTFLASFYKTKN